MLYIVHVLGEVFYYTVRYCTKIMSVPIELIMFYTISTISMYYNTLFSQVLLGNSQDTVFHPGH